MRRFASLGVAALTTVALAATPALISSATAAPGTSAASVASSALAGPVAKAKGNKIKIKKSDKGVQPGIGEMKLTATGLGKSKGKVKFVVKGDAGKVKKSIKVKNGKAVYKVPPLGTGKYKVTAKLGNKKGKTKFEVYDSLLTVTSTTFTISAARCFDAPPLTGSIKYKGAPAKVGGYADVYQDGNIKGGASSPSFVGFGAVAEGGTFTYSSFACAVADHVSNAPGTYFFNVYYTDDAGFEDYISSNVITVNLTA